MKPSHAQRKIIDGWIHTSRYVFNKTLAAINAGHKVNKLSLRDKLVTESTKKNNAEYRAFTSDLANLQADKKRIDKEWKNETDTVMKNCIFESLTALKQTIEDKKKSRSGMAKSLVSEKVVGICDWELKTPKEVRAEAVYDVCRAHTSGFSNLRAGRIKHFRIHFKKKSDPDKCICVPKSLVKNHGGVIHIAPSFFKDSDIQDKDKSMGVGGCKFKMGKKTVKKYRGLVIDHDTRIVKQKDVYWLLVPIPQETVSERPQTPYSFCGIDPGVRTFMTVFSNSNTGETDTCIEYQHDNMEIKKLNAKHDMLLTRNKPKKEKENGKVDDPSAVNSKLKNNSINTPKQKRALKRKINRVETRKSNLIDELHWKVINALLKRHDVVFYGDIKSHNIVKNNDTNHTLNKNINDMKFYKFKTRLLFKAVEKNKKVVLVNEAYTSQTCSFCGKMYKPGCSKVYECRKCHARVDRDINASKNILMKGILK